MSIFPDDYMVNHSNLYSSVLTGLVEIDTFEHLLFVTRVESARTIISSSLLHHGTAYRAEPTMEVFGVDSSQMSLLATATITRPHPHYPLSGEGD